MIYKNFEIIFNLIKKFPSSKSSHMITFYFENGCVMTIRTSGTEPKIKWYTEIRQKDKSK